jgi:glycosyltransferase 2 family protein
MLGVGLLAWFVAGLEWKEVWAVLREVHGCWVAVAAAVMIAHYGVHAWRWGVLLEPVDDTLDARTLWSATTIGWAFNTLLPLRAGNFLRPAVVAIHRPVPYGALLFTTLAEIVCDLFAVLVMLLAMSILLPSELGGRSLEQLKLAGIAAGSAGLFVVAVVVLLSTTTARNAVIKGLKPLPPRLGNSLTTLFDQLVLGLAGLAQPRRLARALLLSLLLWFCWLLAILSVLAAFRVDLPLAGALFIQTALAVAMMVPQAPGFLGVFHVVTEEALRLWGANAAAAQGVALILWSVCFVPITVLGVVDGWRLGIGFVDTSTLLARAAGRDRDP